LNEDSPLSKRRTFAMKVPRLRSWETPIKNRVSV
jgi:hypothetical protein